MSRVGPITPVRVAAVVLDGFAQGVFAFAVLLVAELIAAGADGRAVLGAPLPALASYYLLAGAFLGAAIGVAAGLIARVVPLRPARLSGVVLAVGCGWLFAFRATPVRDLAEFQPRVAAVIIAGAVALIGGYVWARRPARYRSSQRRALRFARVVAAALACGITTLWIPFRHDRLPVRAEPCPDAPNVVVVLVDALRPDRLSSFGYERPTSPFIDSLASQGTAFINAYSHATARSLRCRHSSRHSIRPMRAPSSGGTGRHRFRIRRRRWRRCVAAPGIPRWLPSPTRISSAPLV
jgi:hypothetical protein